MELSHTNRSIAVEVKPLALASHDAVHHHRETASILGRGRLADVALIDELKTFPTVQEDSVVTVLPLTDKLCAMLPPWHPLSKNTKVSRRDLQGECWAFNTTAYSYTGGAPSGRAANSDSRRSRTPNAMGSRS